MPSLPIALVLMMAAAAPDILPNAAETQVDHPWYTCPVPGPPADPAGYYPVRAQRAGVIGSAEIECRLPAGATKFSACAWVSEDPPDYRFGETAAKLACRNGRGGMAPQADSKDRVVKFRTNFKLPKAIAHGDHGDRH